MIHFAFRFDFVNGRELRVASKQSAADIIQLPFLEAVDGELTSLCLAGAPSTVLASPQVPLSAEEVAKLIHSNLSLDPEG